MTFIKRKITVKFGYGTGPQGLDEPRIVELAGHRVMCNVVTAGGAGMGQLHLRIFGLTPQLMAELSTVGKLPTVYARNTVTVFAGDDQSGMSQVYQGTMSAAYADMGSLPDAAFVVIGAVGLIEALMSIPPNTYKGEWDAAVILGNLAKQMGLAFENNGVSVILRDSYFPGAARAQAESCIKAANIDWVIDNGVLAIWPKGGARGGTVPILSPETGLVGYPTYTATGVIATILYNPNIVFGALVEIVSELLPACGKWRVVTITHELSAELPGGPWFSQLQLTRPENLIVGR